MFLVGIRPQDHHQQHRLEICFRMVVLKCSKVFWGESYGRFSFATTEISAVATAEISAVAAAEISACATAEISAVATAEISAAATADVSAVDCFFTVFVSF